MVKTGIESAEIIFYVQNYVIIMLLKNCWEENVSTLNYVNKINSLFVCLYAHH